MFDLFEKPELRFARIAPREYASFSVELRLCSARSFSLRSRGLLNNIYYPCNVIRLIMSFLSRSTQESGFQTTNKAKDPK